MVLIYLYIHNKSCGALDMAAAFICNLKDLPLTYFSLGAPTGQVSAQAPQLMQVSSSITYFPSPSEIASTGQAPAHAPQAMHSSLIVYGIKIHLLINFITIVPHIQKKSTACTTYYLGNMHVYSISRSLFCIEKANSLIKLSA